MSYTFINLSSNSAAFLTFCSGSVDNLERALKILVKCGKTELLATLTTLYSDSQA